MTVRELFNQLGDMHPDAKVLARDDYGEGEFEITGLLYDDNEVVLVGENND